MSNTINTIQSQALNELFQTTFNELEKITKNLQDDFSSPTSSIKDTNSQIPTLTPPKSKLSLETLVNAIGFENRRIACKAGVDSLEAKAKEQKEIGDKELKEIQTQLEKMAKQKVLNGFLKAFKIIGAIFGAIASAVTVAVGAMTGNPLAFTAGVIGMAMAIESTLSLATDGKISLMRGFTEAGKAMGLDEKTTQIFAICMQTLITLASVAISFGVAGTANTVTDSVTKGVEITNKATQLLTKSQQILNISSGIVSVAEGSGQIANSVLSFEVAKTEVNKKMFEAILERLRESIEMEKELVEAEMKRSEELLSKVNDIVQEQNATQQVILTTPTFA